MVPSEKRGTARMRRGVAGHGPCPFSQQTFPTRLLCAKPGSRPRSQQWTRRNKTPYSSETCFLGAGRGSIEEPHVRGLRRQEKALNRSLLREPLRTEIAYLNRSQLCRNGRGEEAGPTGVRCELGRPRRREERAGFPVLGFVPCVMFQAFLLPRRIQGTRGSLGSRPGLEVRGS